MFIHASVDGYPGCFNLLTLVTSKSGERPSDIFQNHKGHRQRQAWGQVPGMCQLVLAAARAGLTWKVFSAPSLVGLNANIRGEHLRKPLSGP